MVFTRKLMTALGLLVFVSLGANAESVTQTHQMSMGAFYGANLGATATYNYNIDYFVDAAFSMEFGGNKNVYSWGDILKRQDTLFSLSGYNVRWFWGGGVKFRSENDPDLEEEYYLGPRAVVGLHSHISPMPLEVFSEIAITQYVTQTSKNEFDFALGARYYF